MKKNRFFLKFLLPVLLLALSTSCKKELVPETQEAVLSGAGERKLETTLLKSVRSETSKFNSTTQAVKAGHQADDHCVSVPGLGGMGYHWVNPSLVDPVFDPLKPEAILYAPGPGGKLRLVAVEYIVVNTGQAAPKFGDQPFDDGGTPLPIPHWSLHVWIHEENPSGMFAPFNPNVSCP